MAEKYEPGQDLKRHGQLHLPPQETKDEDDGSMLMRFKTGALAEVQRQILSYGKHVKVLEPASLVIDVVNELRAALHLYDGE